MLFELFLNLYIAIENNKKTAVSLAVSIYLTYKLIIYPFFLSPLKKVPGPYIHRITKLRALNLQRTEKWIGTVQRLHKIYGSVVILSPTEISVNGDFKFINDIYIKNFPKSKFYENFKNHGNRDNIFASLENDQHLRYKKIVMSLYSKSSIFSPNNQTRKLLIEKVGHLVNQVYESSVTGNKPDYINAKSELNEHGKGHIEGNGEWFNINKKIQNLGIDVYSLFGSLAMDVVSGFELGYENGTDLLLHPEKRHIIISHRLQASMGFWTTLMPRLWSWAATSDIMKASEVIEDWQLGIYNNAENNVPKFKPEENLTTLETFKKSGFFGKNAYTFLSDNIFAGHETTAIQLTYLTYELSRPTNSKFQQHLKNELQEKFGKPTSPYDIIDDLEQVDKLPFLDSLLQENSRIHTSIPGAEPRLTNCNYPIKLNNGEEITVPIGTTISCLPYAMHRTESVFPDPENFNPNRWMPNGKEDKVEYNKRILRQQKLMMPFGKGIRMCLGMHLAVIEMKLAIANLYWHYESKICQDWCRETKAGQPIKLGYQNSGNNETDEEKMVMIDTYTTRPYNDECWLEWY